jgi:inosine-uridine nucleoside N-ribohydrolase
MALLLACGSPEIELVGVTTGGGQARQRARMAAELLRRAGRSDVPVYAGMSNRLLPYKPSHFGACHGHGLRVDDVGGGNTQPRHAVGYLLDQARLRGPELTLVAIGPLSNIGAAVAVDARAMERFQRLVIMGGVFWGERAAFGEYNIACDPEAARVVLELSVPTTFVGLDVTLQVVNGPVHMARLREANTPLTDLAQSMLADYQGRLGRETNHLHDPLALACAFDESFLRFVEAPLEVETEEGDRRGVTTVLERGTPKRLAREVDGEAFMDLFVDRLMGLGRRLA